MALAFSNVAQYKVGYKRGAQRVRITDVTLDGSYVAGGWALAASDFGLNTALNLVIPPAFKSGYAFEFDSANSKLKCYRGGNTGFSMTQNGTWAVDGDGAKTNGGGIVGDVTLTEAAAAYAVVDDGGTMALLSASSAEAGYTADYQIFPDTSAADDAVYFGNSVPFCEIAVNVDTAADYTSGAVAWEYYDGDSWETLSIVLDNSGSDATDGTTPFQQDGAISFIPPSDWAATSVNSQSAYWVRCRVTTGLTTEPTLDSEEHSVVTPADAFIAPCSGTVTSIRLCDGASTLHTAADIKFIVMDFTTGAHSGELTFAQDQQNDLFDSVSFDISAGDSLGVLVTQEDGTNEAVNVSLELVVTGGFAEADASDSNLDGMILRCQSFGW